MEDGSAQAQVPVTYVFIAIIMNVHTTTGVQWYHARILPCKCCNYTTKGDVSYLAGFEKGQACKA